MMSVKAVSNLIDVSSVHLKKIIKDFDYEIIRTNTNNGAIRLPPKTVGTILNRYGFHIEEKFIANFSLKGGIGKTVLNASLSHYLSQLSPNGKKILVIDCDMENCLTSMLLNEDQNTDNLVTMYEIIKNDLKVIDCAIPTKYSMLDIIPSHVKVLKAEKLISGKNPRKALDKYFENIFKKYSIVIFDMSPSLSAINMAILLKLDFLNIILNPDVFALESAFLLVDELKEISKEFDAKMPLFSLTMNRWNPGRIASTDVYKELISSEFAPYLSPIQIKESSSIVNALNEGKTILESGNKATRESFIEMCNHICPLVRNKVDLQ